MMLGKGLAQVLLSSPQGCPQNPGATSLHFAAMPKPPLYLAALLLALCGAARADTCLVVAISDGDTLKALTA